MKFFEITSVFEYPWSEVAQGIWKRYPNPQSTHVLSEDTICRRVEGNKLFTKRIITKTNKFPKWGERFVNAKSVSLIEESIIDRETMEISTYTRNIGLSKVMAVVEKVTYRPSLSNPGCTEVEKKAWISSRIFGLSYAIEKFGIDRYRKNVPRTNNGFLHVLKKMFPNTLPDLPHVSPDRKTLEDHKLRLKDAARETAKRAKDIAKEKAIPAYVSCEGS